ncbi:MAG: carbohydrate kinase family protein [Candidatus Cloacimonetes bacterium]|nr:carbohydrate kinase family protein [Candidatus Cloacimonadota bacterium]
MPVRDLDVVVLGAVGIDTSVYLMADDIDFQVEANFSENIDTIGQAGGYAARSFNRLGKRTGLIAAWGDDYPGAYIREQLHSEGIDISGCFIDPAGTKRSINFMYKDGRRKNFYDGKGAMAIKPDLAKCRQILSRTKLVHVNIVNWTRYLLPLMKELELTIAVDLQDMIRVDDPYRQDYLDHADIIFFSAVNFPDDLHKVITKILERKNIQFIIAGNGSRGVTLGCWSGVYDFPAVDLPFAVIDTNGAGDSLAAGFLSSFVLDGYNRNDSLFRGQICARYCCSQKGNSNELITRKQLDEFYKSKKKIT